MYSPRNKTKVALVKPAKNEDLLMWQSWCDGLYGAMQVLGETYNLKVFGYCDTPAYLERGNIGIHLSDNISSLKYWLASFGPKYVFGWGTSYDKWEEVQEYNGEKAEKKILLYAGGPINQPNARKKFNQVVVENESDREFFPDSVVAFGTNTDVFKPMKLNKLYPALYPAAFASWKHHELFAQAMPVGSLAVGMLIESEKQCYQNVIDSGHLILPALPMTVMPYLYNQSQGVCLTPEHMGGCQRAALEAMACGIPVLCTNNSKAAEFDGVWTCDPDPESIRQAYINMILMFQNGEYNLREQFILGKLDHFEYAKKLAKLLC
jgi:glycosyltransferase involved in cell wall biosynthesis